MTNKTEKDQNVQMPENENIQDEEQLKEEPEVEEQEAKDTSEASAESSEEKEKTGEEAKEDEDLNSKYLRLMADFQNYKKRTEKQKSEIHAYANEKIVLKLIEVMDNFERALGADASEGDSFKQGIEMIFKQLSDVLTDAGVKEIEAESTVFDPNFHNAVMMEDTDKVESGMVSEVLQKGYTLNGKVIRPAMVKVAN